MQTCANCGIEIADTDNLLLTGEKKPCPKCGSIKRNYHLIAGTGGFKITGSAAGLIHIWFSENVLKLANDQFAKGEFSLAIILAQTACEVGAERVFTLTYQDKGIKDLGEEISGLLRSNNLTNGRVLKIFKVLTGKSPASEPFWPQLGKATELRNDVVHSGVKATKDQAEEAIEAATGLVKWLKANFK